MGKAVEALDSELSEESEFLGANGADDWKAKGSQEGCSNRFSQKDRSLLHFCYHYRGSAREPQEKRWGNCHFSRNRL